MDFSAQRISRLTPLKAVLDLIDAKVAAVKPQRRAIATTCGHTLAEDVVSSQCPEHPIALRDGFAVEAVAIADASSYAPVPLPQPIRRIDVGEPMPEGTDAVLPLDAVVLRGQQAEAVAAVMAGEGVLPAGGDAPPRAIMRPAGERMRSVDAAAVRAAGVESALVREPRIAVAPGGEPGTRPLHAVIDLLIRAASASGATAANGPDQTLEAAVTSGNNDAIIAVGGTGSGQRDTAVQTLARLGRVEVHGIAIAPGETAAFGFVDTRPVLLVPGRLDAALAVWLLIGRYLVAKLAGGSVEVFSATLPLKRKVTSTIGLTELMPVRCAAGMAEPLASGYMSLTSLARSDGWIAVPADSEGFAEGTPVAVKPWP
jgi:molybdopterin molybdotransferase